MWIPVIMTNEYKKQSDTEKKNLKKYSPPVLNKFGTVKSLTTGGSMGAKEASSGQSAFMT